MKKILVVEDDTVVRESINEILTSTGYEIIEAKDGEDGIQSAKEHIPALILCDIMMPKKDGYQVLQELQQNVQTRSIPFIFLTARVSYDEFRNGMNAGADDYITKPFRARELIKLVNKQISKYEDNFK
jgi:CheY-like chemotaxis protein